MGLICVEIPCPDCGIPPERLCLPKPCDADACWSDADCGAERTCVGDEPWAAEPGRCLAEVTPPRCWSHADCPPQAHCSGASFCPPCVDCLAIEQAGACKANGGVHEVLLYVDDTFMQPGQALRPVWYNFSSQAVYLPGCTTYVLEWLDESTWTWKELGPPAECVWEGVARLVEPGDAWEAMDMALPEPPAWGYGTYRVRGAYWTGCTDGQPISAGCAAGPVEVVSDEIGVGWPM